jgi:formylglycine-generating enzyme required for sulfatase activity
MNDIWDNTSPARKFEPNNWKLYDMSGNVWEWCGDWFDANYYGVSPEADPPGPEKGTDHVKRGGSYYSEEKEERVSVRRFSHATDNNTGFRCVLPQLAK